MNQVDVPIWERYTADDSKKLLSISVSVKISYAV